MGRMPAGTLYEYEMAEMCSAPPARPAVLFFKRHDPSMKLHVHATHPATVWQKAQQNSADTVVLGDAKSLPS